VSITIATERILRMEAFLFDAESQGEVTLGEFNVVDDDQPPRKNPPNDD
jgi:hypothetical protein